MKCHVQLHAMLLKKVRDTDGGQTLTHNEWMRVSVALQFSLLLLGSPGRPYMMAQLALLEPLICRRRS